MSYHPINKKYCSKGYDCDHINHNIKCPRKDMIHEYNHNILYARDVEYIKKISTNAKNKSKKRINNIISSISKIKKGQSKKYQYRDEKYELNEIINYIKENSNLRYELKEDNKMFVNKLDKIIAGRDSGCCNECNGKMIFVNKKIPRKYIIVTKIFYH
jgi:hypothetical protein